MVAERQTVGVQAAGTAEAAWILALLCQTGHIKWTVRVSTTSSKALGLDANVPDSALLVRLALTSLNASVVQAKLF